MALLLKAETLKKVFVRQTNGKDEDADTTYQEMEASYLTLVKLGYREMPEKMYLKWINSIAPATKSPDLLKNP